MSGSSVLHYFPKFALNSCPLSQWYYLPTSSSANPFSFLPSIFPRIRVFFNEFTPHIKVEASIFNSSLSSEYSGWFPLTGLSSLQSKGLPRVFSSTTIQKYPFFSIQPSLWLNSHVRIGDHLLSCSQDQSLYVGLTNSTIHIGLDQLLSLMPQRCLWNPAMFSISKATFSVG